MEIYRIIKRIRIAYAEHIERFFYVNHYNILMTLYINLKMLPFRQAVRLPVSVYGWPRLYSLYGNFSCEKCYFGMVQLNKSVTGSPGACGGPLELNLWGEVKFRGKCEICSGSKITVGNNAVLDMGEGSRILHQCNIAAYCGITVGAQSWIVHRCQLVDTNFHFIADFSKGHVNNIARPIKIGEYCWICNSSTITGGAIIPDKTIVASNSLVGKDFSDIPSESIVGGVPARLISTGYRKIDNTKWEGEIKKYFATHKDAPYFEFDNNVSHDICNING